METRIQGDSGLEYRWHGGHTVNIYSGGEEVDVFTMGAEEATYEELTDSIERREACLAGNHDTPTDEGYCSWCGEPVS